MKVLLVQSYLGGNEPLVFPLGLACLAATLKEHRVEVFDANTAADPFHELRDRVKDFEPDVVGISIRNIDSTNKRKVVFYYPYLEDTIAAVRSVSNARLVAGGSGFSMFAEQIMEDEPKLDFGIALEGEAVFAQFLDHLETPEQVPSLYYREDGRVLFSGPAPSTDMNAVPLPDHGVLPLETYRSSREALGVETKRGCPLRCIYCVYGYLNGKAYRLREPARVVDDIQDLAARGARRFTFVDSVFNLPLEHAEQICRELIERNLTVRWSAWLSECGFTGAFLDLAVRAGCDHVILSPDGFSDVTLKRLGKDMGQADILRAYRLLRSHGGVEVSYNFFKNPPGQSLRGFLGMLLFCLRAKLQMGRRIHFEFSSLRIEPHTRLHRIALEEGVVGAEESLLFPKHYTQARTRYIEVFCDVVLRLAGK